MACRFRANANLILRKIAGEYLLIPTGELAMQIHGMIGLTESGCLLFEKLRSGADREELIAALTAEYEVDADEAGQDVDAFLEKMRCLNILEEAE